jgi:tetratricopeptide (TPR) repeat protein
MKTLSLLSVFLWCAVMFVRDAVAGFNCDVPEDLNDFLQMVNQSATAGFKAAEMQAQEIGPQLKVGIVSGFHPTEGGHSTYALALNEMYATHHGYTFKILAGVVDLTAAVQDSVSSHNPFRNWIAVNALRSALKSWASDYDYIVYISSDAVILNFDLRLEKIAVKYKKSNVVLVSGGTEAMITTDFILVRNNFWTVDFLEDWWKFYQDDGKKGVRDADVFQKYYRSDEAEMKDNVAIIPEGTLIAENPPLQRFKKVNSILTMINQASAMKRALFKHAHVQLCNAVEEAEGGAAVQLPAQLGISRAVILDTSLRVYQDLWEEKIEMYMQKSDKGENDFRATDELSFVASHLVLALTIAKTDESKQALANIRSKTFKHMYLNMKRNENKEATEDLIYTLKSVLRFGQDYVVHVQDKKEKKVAMKVIKELLEELMVHRENDHDTQEALVNMNCDIGQMYVDEQRYEDALPEFLAALRIARRVGNYIGERVILAPANHAADTLLLLKRFEEATVMYTVAVHLIRKFYGKNDLTTGYALVQSSIANFYFKKYKTCFKQAEEALEIMAEEGQEEPDQQMWSHALQMREQCTGKKDEDATSGGGGKDEF